MNNKTHVFKFPYLRIVLFLCGKVQKPAFQLPVYCLWGKIWRMVWLHILDFGEPWIGFAFGICGPRCSEVRIIFVINMIFKFVSAFATTSEYYIRICWWYYRNKCAKTVRTRSRERIPNSGTKRFVCKYFSMCFVLVTLSGPACGSGGWVSIARKSWKLLYTKWN